MCSNQWFALPFGLTQLQNIDPIFDILQDVEIQVILGETVSGEGRVVCGRKQNIELANALHELIEFSDQQSPSGVGLSIDRPRLPQF